MEDIYIVMELKVNESDQALADAQLYRRYYRMTSTSGIQEWVYGVTLCGSMFRVQVHTPCGIIRTESIDCSTEAGFRSFKRFLLRILRILEDDLKT
ncbi:BZ3500_MvSof-1268-A1-R1_Chr3-3g06610 [Microbotryum saponariae]|uniref:BZ3500_MvSof-1268-A1-R1_Chr3-3g06610 protein n=1 Tax=Microbotryum saponariae TaxID=289078 RepID=A0A2X0KYE3_9BASI|nr:BZ3500_MvSof-1268-A1-R1_Chr3-3g06610 [Microbotryum saponariae]SDA04577.1 BZ3501_MvSof-1269-A2-R1_Chr3-2g06297 [Microbotryum saponariae]